MDTCMHRGRDNDARVMRIQETSIRGVSVQPRGSTQARRGNSETWKWECRQRSARRTTVWDTNEEDDDVHRLGVDDACSDRCDVSAECRIESVDNGKNPNNSRSSAEEA